MQTLVYSISNKTKRLIGGIDIWLSGGVRCEHSGILWGFAVSAPHGRPHEYQLRQLRLVYGMDGHDRTKDCVGQNRPPCGLSASGTAVEMPSCCRDPSGPSEAGGVLAAFDIVLNVHDVKRGPTELNCGTFAIHSRLLARLAPWELDHCTRQEVGRWGRCWGRCWVVSRIDAGTTRHAPASILPAAAAHRTRLKRGEDARGWSAASVCKASGMNRWVVPGSRPI